jgi:hemoglobin/transferrin/lactoferrin receptor protein
MIEKVNVLGGNIQLSKSLSSSAQLTYGTELYYNSVQSDAYSINLSNFIVSTNNSRYPSGGSNIFFPSLYGNYNIKKNRFSIMAGVRYTWNHIYASYGDNSLEFISGSLEIKKHSINGSFNTIFYPNKNTKFFLDLSTGFRSPNIDDLGKVFIKDEFLTVPNNELIPEYAYNLSLGLRSQKELNKYKFSFSASSFATLLDNVITKQSFEIDGDNVINYEGSSYELLANQNAKSALVYGASGSLGFNIKKFNFHSSICYTKGEITKSQLSMSHIPPVFGKINFKYSFKKFDLHILNVFNSNKTLESFGDGNTDNPAEATKEGYPKWWIVNTKATYYWKKLIILNMGVYNLFDIHYKTFSSGISAPGRSLMISAKLAF